jgi:protease-4
MKKNPLLPALIILIVFSFKAYSQDFNLLNPGNELYLFSAYDEGANAFRYNPAVLGLNHRFNATVNMFLKTLGGTTTFNEFDVLINFGRLGIGFRNSNENISNTYYYDSLLNFYNAYTDSYDYKTNTFSMGFGIGNKTFSGGILGEYMFRQDAGTLIDYLNSNPRYRISFGLLYRPFKFLSASFVYKSNEALSVHSTLSDKYTIGAALRPLGNDRLTLAADFSFSPRSTGNIFGSNQIKLGAEARIIPGLSVNANYTKIDDYFRNESFNIGFTIEGPHVSMKYNQILNNTRISYLDLSHFGGPRGINQFDFSSGSKYKYVGSSLSFSYNSEKKKSFIPERKKVVEITLSGTLQDYNTEDVFFGLLGKGKRSVHEVIADIDYAAGDPSVKGMLLRIYPLSTGRLEINAAMEELSNAMERFKAKGKKITAYFPQDAGPAEYYLATFANDIVLPPEALLFYGLSIDVFNYRQFLQKYGIELQNFHAGKYKLTFQGILDSTTEEGKEVINRILDVVYDKMISRITVARNITLDDNMKTKISQPLNARDALRLGLVDKLGWYDDAKQISEDHTKTDNVVKHLNRNMWDNDWSEPDAIAIIGVYASITPGESEPPPLVSLPIPYIGGSRSTGSETVVRQLEDAFANPKIKVIILRVDSGGGSVLGSAEISDAIFRLKKKYNKPFYVSMGGSAASGGYYVSVNADKIFTDELTVTGSIGVFTSRPNIDSLLREQKLKVENFKRGENSDIGSYYKKLSPDEIEIIQGIIDYYYDRFIDAITEGRKLSREEVEQVAQGHVWLGSDAVNKKLVDEIGGLYETINYAKKKAGIKNRYKLVYYSVPGGETVSDVITTSVVRYIEQNLLHITDFDGDQQDIEIKY